MAKKIILFVLILLASLTATWFFVVREKNNNSAQLYTLRINNAELKVELAQSQGQRGEGLGDRKYLPPNQGMLFIFEKSDVYPFWMRHMQFPLDIIWLDSNYQVVDLAKNADPASYPNSFTPKKEALYVLEVNAGWADKNKINTGDQAILNWQEP